MIMCGLGLMRRARCFWDIFYVILLNSLQLHVFSQTKSVRFVVFVQDNPDRSMCPADFCDWELSYFFVSIFYFLPMLYFLLISNSPQITFTSILVSQEMEFFESP